MSKLFSRLKPNVIFGRYRLLTELKHKNFLIRLATPAATLAWMGFIFFLSSLKGSPGGDQHWNSNWQSNVGHMVLFGILTTLILATLSSWRYRITLLTSAIVVALVTLFALSDEYHQSFVLGRHATFSDVLFDIAGSLIICVLMVPLTYAKKSIYAYTRDSIQQFG